MRCVVEIGDRHDPTSIAYLLSRVIIDEVVYNTVKNHLTGTGIDLGGPPGYLTWIDPPNNQQFLARCCDINTQQSGPTGKQPMNYLIVAAIVDTTSTPWTARAERFFHDADPRINKG